MDLGRAPACVSGQRLRRQLGAMRDRNRCTLPERQLLSAPMRWDDAVVYQVYIRSFQDSNGDGIGDLRGVISRLEHIAGLGVATVWLSPIYVSPNADFGYDVADYTAVDPSFGTLADFDELIDAAHELGLKVLLDFVPCHTSIEHPWFRERTDFYTWADAPPNNWRASFGGSAWELDPVSGRYYLHSFFPEQADLNWRNPDVREAMTSALRFWRRRGVDGFRLDALDRLMKDPELRDDPPATGPPSLPIDPEDALLRHTNSRNAPDIGDALRSIREAVGDAFLVGEVYLPAAELPPYLESLDAAFAFEAIFAAADADRLRTGISSALEAGRQGWVLSNHDFSRLASRVGEVNARAAAMLVLSLPGPAFMLQGDEIGLPDGPVPEPPLDRHGRDAFRLPMPWDRSANGAFTPGTPWLPPVDASARNVADQQRDADSHLSFFRRMIRLRREFEPTAAELLPSPPDTVVLARGAHVIAVNLGDQPRQAPAAGELVIEARPGDGADLRVVPAHGGWIARRAR
jgi:alpha-glucosidase